MTEQDATSKIPGLNAGRVAVVGSLNQDLSLSIERIPGPGETLLIPGHSSNAGGKGGNQAIAARRFLSEVSMIGAVGGDEAGRTLLALLATEGIDAGGVRVDNTSLSGVAVIIVEPSGENRIMVSQGANAAVSRELVTANSEAVASADVVLAQLEVSVAVVTEAFRIARGTTILNAAPAGTIPAELLSLTDVLVVNESELAALAGAASEADTAEEIERQAASIHGSGTVVVTRGARGCVLLQPGKEALSFAAPVVNVVDTTAAGDCFCGSLAAQLARGILLTDAVPVSVRAASVSATRAGASVSIPTAAELAVG
jgi:ribokinase